MMAPLSLLGLLLILCTSNTYATRVGPIITAGNLTCDFTPYLIPFVDALEIPAKAVLHNNKYTLTVSETPGLKLHRDLPPTTMWVYNGQFPGPTFDVQKNQAIHVTIVNNLPINRPLLPIQDLGQGMPPDRIVVHLHGGVNKPQYCGHPLDFVRPYNGSNTYTNYYANQQEAAGLWYHDHVMGLTVPNVYGGMAGAYFIRDAFEDSLNLPTGDFEIPLVISAKEVNLTTGQLYMQFLRSPPLIPNYNLVNNKIWPYLEVSQNRYRFRLLNAANHRTYHLYSDPPMTMHVIGSDDGFLDKSAVTSDLFLGTGERYDVIIDFSQFPVGTNITLMNDALDPFSNGTGAAPGQPIPCPGHFIMQFRVTSHAKHQPQNNIPNIMRYPAFNYRSDQIARLKHRNFTLFQPINPKFQIDGKPFLSRLHPYVPVGSSEVWTFINYNDRIAHPVHIHLVNFRVLSRQYVTINNPYIFNNSNPYIEGYPTQPYMITPRYPATGPNEYEKGPKDIVITYPNSVTSILIENFGPYTGEYIWHCHALDHEENDMMQRWAVVPRGPDCQQDEDQWDHC